jgi:hypothetical protein
MTRKAEDEMELLVGVLVLGSLGWIVIEALIHLFRAPYRCSCGFETRDPDEALRHQGHGKHEVK